LWPGTIGARNLHRCRCRIHVGHDPRRARVSLKYLKRSIYSELFHFRRHGSHFEKHKLAFEKGGGLDDAYDTETPVGVDAGTPDSSSMDEKRRVGKEGEHVEHTV